MYWKSYVLSSINAANVHTETIILCHFNNDTEQIIATLLHYTNGEEDR